MLAATRCLYCAKVTIRAGQTNAARVSASKIEIAKYLLCAFFFCWRLVKFGTVTFLQFKHTPEKKQPPLFKRTSNYSESSFSNKNRRRASCSPPEFIVCSRRCSALWEVGI